MSDSPATIPGGNQLGYAQFCAQEWYVEEDMIALLPGPGMGMMDAPVPAITVAQRLGFPAIFIPVEKFEAFYEGLPCKEALCSLEALR